MQKEHKHTHSESSIYLSPQNDNGLQARSNKKTKTVQNVRIQRNRFFL